MMEERAKLPGAQLAEAPVLPQQHGWRSYTPRARAHRSGESGQSMVEFALILLPLLMLIIGVVEFGRALYDYSAVSNAARVGARSGITAPPVSPTSDTDTSDTKQSAIITKAQSGAAGIPAAQLIVSVKCAASASSTFATCSSNNTSGNRLQVQVTHCYQTIIPNWIKLSALSCNGTSNRLALVGQSRMFIE